MTPHFFPFFLYLLPQIDLSEYLCDRKHKRATEVYIESGHHGGKKLPDGSKNPIHSAAVIGDTVGDPCKDTSGPSLNILIKLMSMVSIVFTPVIVKFSPIVQGWLGIIMK